jgi:ribonucleoside-diphosphate reductase alpha chain
LLGSFAIPKYLVRDLAGYYFNWPLFIADIPHVVRMMDNVIDKANYPLPQQREEATSKRRMGLGVTGPCERAGSHGNALWLNPLRDLRNQAPERPT